MFRHYNVTRNSHKNVKYIILAALYRDVSVLPVYKCALE